MKFSSGIDALNRENESLRLYLKLAILSLGLLSLAIVIIADRDPIMIEKSSQGLEVVHPVKLRRSDGDVKVATELMLKARFNTTNYAPDIFLSDRQMELRATEQHELKARGLAQAIIIRSVKLEKSTTTIEFDRVIAIGEVRSAIRTVAQIEFQHDEPNELNPYGLKLATLTTIENKEVKK